jgi:hypothetical protein
MGISKSGFGWGIFWIQESKTQTQIHTGSWLGLTRLRPRVRDKQHLLQKCLLVKFHNLHSCEKQKPALAEAGLVLLTGAAYKRVGRMVWESYHERA